MRLTFLLLFFTLMSCIISKDAVIESNSSIKFNKKISQEIISENYGLRNDLYLTKKQLKKLMNTITPKIPQNQISEEINNYNSNRKKFNDRYLSNFKPYNLLLSGCEKIDWKKCSVDSLTYDYHILVPDGKDKVITWPESKYYIPPNHKIVCCKCWVFISDFNLQYGIHIESIFYEGEWKFYSNVKAPRINKISHNKI